MEKRSKSKKAVAKKEEVVVTELAASVEPVKSVDVHDVVSRVNGKREPIAKEELDKVVGMPRNIQVAILRRTHSIGQIADALGIPMSSVPTQAKAGEKALEKMRGIAGLIGQLPA